MLEKREEIKIEEGNEAAERDKNEEGREYR